MKRTEAAGNWEAQSWNSKGRPRPVVPVAWVSLWLSARGDPAPADLPSICSSQGEGGKGKEDERVSADPKRHHLILGAGPRAQGSGWPRSPTPSHTCCVCRIGCRGARWESQSLACPISLCPAGNGTGTALIWGLLCGGSTTYSQVCGHWGQTWPYDQKQMTQLLWAILD